MFSAGNINDEFLLTFKHSVTDDMNESLTRSFTGDEVKEVIDRRFFCTVKDLIHVE